MEEEIKQAISLLRNNGYIVRKLTKAMTIDCNKCEEMSNNGEDMDCLDCACSVCIVQ